MRVEAATHPQQFGGLLSRDYTRGIADTTVIRIYGEQARLLRIPIHLRIA